MGRKPGGSYREVLATPDARSLVLASGASQIGEWLSNATLLAVVYGATGSATWVAATAVLRMIPHVLLGPLGRVVAGRYDTRSVLIVGGTSRSILMLGLALVVAADGPVAVVIGLTAVASVAGAAERPASMALVPRLVGEARLGPANALLHTAHRLGVVIGPALGALILTVTSEWTAFLANAITFAASAALVSTMRTTSLGHHTGERTSASSDLAHGLRSTRATPYVVPLFLVVAMVEFTYGAQTVQLVLYASDRLDLGAGGYGYLLAIAGLGGLLSAILSGRLASSHRAGSIAVGMGVVAGGTQLVYGATDAVAVAIAVTLIGGLGLVSCEVVAETALARVVEPAVLGRVMGVFHVLSVGAMVLGALLAPLVTSWTSLETGFVVLGAVAMTVTAASLLGLRGLSELARRRQEQLGERIAVLERLPITVGVPRVAIEQLATASQLCPLPGGVDVVVQGAPAHAFYAVIDGSVVVHRDGEKVTEIAAGGHFGERGLLDRAPRNATVTTVDTCTLLRIEGDALLDALQVAPAALSSLDHSNTPRRSSEPDERDTSSLDDQDLTPS